MANPWGSAPPCVPQGFAVDDWRNSSNERWDSSRDNMRGLRPAQAPGFQAETFVNKLLANLGQPLIM